MTDSHSEITLDALLFPLDATSKVDVIRKLVDAIRGHPKLNDVEALYRAILTREEEAPTCLGMSVAMPHARTRAVKEIVIIGARLETPMAWGGPDKMAQFVFLLGVPPLAIEQYLNVMKTFAHAFKRTDLLKRLESSQSPAEFEKALHDAVGML